MVSFLSRLRRPRTIVPADLRHGFWVREATALQRTLISLPGMSARRAGPLAVMLHFGAGRESRVTVVAHNRLVGFAPHSCAPGLLEQLVATGADQLSAPGILRREAGIWRIWAGPEPAEGDTRPDPEPDELQAEEPKVFGIALSRTDSARTDPGRAPGARPPQQR